MALAPAAARAAIDLATRVSIAAAADLLVSDELHPTTRFATCVLGALVSGGLGLFAARISARIGNPSRASAL